MGMLLFGPSGAANWGVVKWGAGKSLNHPRIRSWGWNYREIPVCQARRRSQVMAYTLAKSDNEVLASWDFSRIHAAYGRSPNE